MPEALATTKRKFYKILDNLSAPPPTPAYSTTTGHPRPLVPKPRLHGRTVHYGSLTPGTDSTFQSRPLASSASMAELRARLGIGAADKRASMMGSTVLKPTNTILHKTGSFASLRSIDKEKDNSQLKDGLSQPEKGLPAFCPWSHDGFLDRLKTFAPVTSWLPKPSDEVSEVAWAKRGWGCAGIETVACGACKKRVVVDFTPSKSGRERKRRKVGSDKSNGALSPLTSPRKLLFGERDNGDDDDDANDDDDFNDYKYEEGFEKGLVDKYRSLIIEGHGDNCPWRQAGCKDDIYRLPVVRREWWQRHISSAFLSALSMADDIEKMNMRELDAQPAVEKILSDIPSGFFTTTHQAHLDQHPVSRPTTPHSGSPRPLTPRSPRIGQSSRPSTPQPSTPRKESQPATVADPENTFSKALQARALAIALTGWTAKTEASTNLLSCSACFQRVGIWLYQMPTDKHRSPAPRADSGHAVDDGADADELDTSVLDLISQHREHCPFRNASTQCSTGDFANLPAWQILYTTVARWADEQRRRSQGYTDGTATSTMPPSSSSPMGYSAKVTAEVAPLSREENAKLDKDRTHKLRKIRKALGIFRVPGMAKDKDAEKLISPHKETQKAEIIEGHNQEDNEGRAEN